MLPLTSPCEPTPKYVRLSDEFVRSVPVRRDPSVLGILCNTTFSSYPCTYRDSDSTMSEELGSEITGIGDRSLPHCHFGLGQPAKPRYWPSGLLGSF